MIVPSALVEARGGDRHASHMATKHLPRLRDPFAPAKLIADSATGEVVDALETVNPPPPEGDGFAG
jgi:hypothetical protein